jgi:predicted  nucleic acid-binding Zn-ribbon protein
MDSGSQQLEAKIQQAERRIAELDAEMDQMGQAGEAEAVNAAERLQQAWNERAFLQENLDEWMEQWLEMQDH